MSAKQGQHIRLRVSGDSFVAHSLDLTFHVSATMEDATTKDTSDSTGSIYLEYEKTKYNADGSVTAIVTTGSDSGTSPKKGMTIDDIKTKFSTEAFSWELLLVNGASNRESQGIICQGSKITFSSVEVSAPKDGYAQVTANFAIHGGITVPS